MKTRLIALNFRGTASVDPRFSAIMLPWIVADIYSRDTIVKLSVGIENDNIEAYNSDFELEIRHEIKFVVGAARITARRCYNGRIKCTNFIALPKSYAIRSSYGATNTSAVTTFGVKKCPTESQKLNDPDLITVLGPENGMIYLIKDPADPLLHIYLYESDLIEEMTELIHQMHDPTLTLGGSLGSIPSLFGSTSSRSVLSSTTTFCKHDLQKALHGGTHSTPASNLKSIEANRLTGQNNSNLRLSSSKSFTNGINHQQYLSTNNIPVNISSCPASGGSSPSNTDFSDISLNNSQFFEVLYVGKIKVSHRRVPITFIDDAIQKCQTYDAQKIKEQLHKEKKVLHTNIRSLDELEYLAKTKKKNGDFETNPEVSQSEIINDVTVTKTIDEIQYDLNVKLQIVENMNDDDDTMSLKIATPSKSTSDATKDTILSAKLCVENKENKLGHHTIDDRDKILIPKKLPMSIPVKSDKIHGYEPGNNDITDNNENNNNNNATWDYFETTEIIPTMRDRAASIGSIPIVEQNRTMVFLIDKTDIRLISPDRKKVLLKKNIKNITSCAQGVINNDHFGIICCEINSNGYIGFVFKCQSGSIADSIIEAMQQAFSTYSEKSTLMKNNPIQCRQPLQNIKDHNQQIFSCEHCPMLWYHKLCTDVDGISDKKIQTVIFRHIETLPLDEQNVILAKFDGAEKMNDNNLNECNQFLMMLLRAHCESKQQRHVHDTAENRSEFLHQYLGGSTIFTKAKRSLTNSFDHLLKRKNSKDDFSIKDNNNNSPRKLELSKKPEMQRPRAASIGTPPAFSNPQMEALKSPKMEMFIKVGNSPKENKHILPGNIHLDNISNKEVTTGWRQEILNRVITPSKNRFHGTINTDYTSPFRRIPERSKKHTNYENNYNNSSNIFMKRSRNEIRELWKTAIHQTILLSRMESQNAKLQEIQTDNELKKIKLDYDEIVKCDKQTGCERWDIFIDKATRITNKLDHRVLLQAIKNGVPRIKRGEIWLFLSEQYSMNQPPIDTKKYPNYDTPYNVLLKNLTEHQHAILIDLGRTFPNHKFYRQSLGIGQLSLFNILKAYSILDPELGYCQGLGFICAVLLLHCDEEDAFNLLKHLMFCRHLRTKYLPDMRDFQLQLYQLSRLVKDLIPDLYDWLDQNEISPTLYAAPWILTVFSSQFPLGFVTRIFDLLFLESSEVIFRVSVAILEVYKDNLLQCVNCEEIMDYLKNTVTQIDALVFDKILKKVFTMNVKRNLSEYEVEYNVLQEEISTTNRHLDALNSEKESNQDLKTQLQFAQSSIVQLEKTRTSKQNQILKLQSQVKSLEVTIDTLGTFLQQLIEHNHNIDVPGDIRRIVQNIKSPIEQRKTPIFIERKIGKSVSVNAQLGFPLKVLEECNESDKDSAQNDNIYRQSSNLNPKFQLKLTRNSGEHSKRKRNESTNNNSYLIGTIPITTSLSSSAIVQKGNITANNLKLPECVEKVLDRMVQIPLDNLSDNDNVTQKSPTSNDNNSCMQKPNELTSSEMHPLSYCGDVNFRFNGTTKLKSIRSGGINRFTGTPNNSNAFTNNINDKTTTITPTLSNLNIDLFEKS